MSRSIRAWWERRRSRRRLRNVALFSGCAQSELAAIDSLVTELAVPAGRVLMREGTGGLDFVVIVDGTATVTRRGRILGEVGAGSFFGELSLLDDAPRTATVTAANPMRIYVLNPFEFRALLAAAPSVRAEVLDAARTRTRALASSSRRTGRAA